ncbi:hypothetical protein F5B19DRAFT_480115 [Rostrohypoxylon terebratum]|nr:hypothetical protein F5B19DRAFT_480115 [Rostrohypoxylon terebratum]
MSASSININIPIIHHHTEMEPNTDCDRQIQEFGGLRLLPPEILLEICSYLSLSDARSLRLCCKRLADTGACYGFRDIAIYCLKSDLDMLRAFSHHPIISKNIKKLTYRAATLVKPELPPFYTADEYSRFFVHRGTQILTGPKQHWLPASTFYPVWNMFAYMNDIEENYKQYKKTALEQFLIVKNKEDCTLLEEVLPRLQALKEIAIDNSPYGNLPPFKSLFAPPCRPRHERSVQAMMYGLCRSGLRINKLSANWLLPSIFNTAFLQQIIPACKYLKSIDLWIAQSITRYDECYAVDPLFENSRRAHEHGALAKFLNSLSSLESLSVRYHDRPWNRWPLRWAIDHGAKWSNLRCIYFHEILTDRRELIAFFRRHRLSLEKVTISKCDLQNTSCKILLCQMKEILKLKQITISSTLEGHFEATEDNTGFVYDPQHPLKQLWWFGSASDPRSLGFKVADWFLRDAPCPLVPGIQRGKINLFLSE